uniref:Uncharacterized protein n=1 Tax=Erpetoichthys calabaricus TaxID=27687 RepID=A0A8C4RXW0_ERPCA
MISSTVPHCVVSKSCPTGCHCFSRTNMFCLQETINEIPDMPTSVKELILVNSDLTSLSAFSCLFSLQLLKLATNELKELPFDLLKKTQRLAKLYLFLKTLSRFFQALCFTVRSNSPTHWCLDGHMLQDLHMLEQLHLFQNKLHTVPNGIFLAAAVLPLHDNPWLCDCCLQYRQDLLSLNPEQLVYYKDLLPLQLFHETLTMANEKRKLSNTETLLPLMSNKEKGCWSCD